MAVVVVLESDDDDVMLLVGVVVLFFIKSHSRNATRGLRARTARDMSVKYVTSVGHGTSGSQQT